MHHPDPERTGQCEHHEHDPRSLRTLRAALSALWMPRCLFPSPVLPIAITKEVVMARVIASIACFGGAAARTARRLHIIV